jgi:hypothetical protein
VEKFYSPILKLIQFCLILSLVACGGGGGGNSAPTTPTTPVSNFETAAKFSDDTWSYSATGDFNNDGLEDLVAAEENFSEAVGLPIKIYIQENGTLVDRTASLINIIPTTILARHIEVADFNNDGYDDIYFGDAPEFGVNTAINWAEQDVLMLSDGAGKYTDVMTTNMPQLIMSGPDALLTPTYEWYTHGGDAADIDNDGDIDLVLNIAYIGLQVFKNDGTGNFAWSAAPGDASFWTIFIDANNNGFVDLYIPNSESAKNIISLNDGTGSFTAGNILMPDPILPGLLEDTALADIDGDGRMDLIVENANLTLTAHGVQILMNRMGSTGNFVDETSTRHPDALPSANNYNAIFDVRDINNDGRKDLVHYTLDNNSGANETGMFVNRTVDGVLTRVTGVPNLTNSYELINISNDSTVDFVFSGSHEVTPGNWQTGTFLIVTNEFPTL